MVKLNSAISLALLILLFITGHEAVAPLFLQAITSALATIPLIGGPSMTTGLVGAKLGIGTKLLYYLGFFGRRSKSIPKKPVPVAKVPGKLQPVPLPYAMAGAGGFPQMGVGGGIGGPFGGGFQQMGGFGGGFQQMGGGGFQGGPFGGGINPGQMFAALRAQGYDANTAMQLLNYGNGGNFGLGGGFMPGGGFENNGANFPPQMPGEFEDVPNFPPQMPGGGQFPQFNPVPGQGLPEEDVGSFGDQQGENLPNQPSENGQEPESDDIESFFTFLRDMDENTCISRLICDIGANPSFLGEFSENIHGIVGSLDVQPTSGAYPYIEIMETGSKEGGCNNRFPECSDTAYEVVKNVAPSVGVPQNLNAAAVNKL